MDKLKMHSLDGVARNIDLIGNLFPNAVTEVMRDGKVERAIDFDVLRQELSDCIVEGREERYQFTWPDKKKAMLAANAPITATLRPVVADSVGRDGTPGGFDSENLYIEGDNLEVLKLLQETYLGKVKMIYIDPPYNTGNDFVYEDDFAQSTGEYMANSGQYDEVGNRMVTNTESNGRFHTDWLNMIYPRLKLAKDLLTDDGIIFISINDKEVNTLRSICSEIFGGSNFLATLVWDKNHSAQAGVFKVYHEYVVVYCKNIDLIGTPKSLNSDLFEAGAMKKVSGRHPASEFTFPAGTRFDAPDGTELTGEYGDTEKVVITKGRMIAKNKMLQEEVTLKAGFTQANQMKQYFYGDRSTLVDSQGQRIVEFYFNSTGKIKVIKERGVESPQTTCHFGTQGAATTELASLFQMEEAPFSAPKPVGMLKDFILRFVNDGDIVLDFFSGSATTAHAVYEANTSGKIKNVKYILVQIAENLDESLKNAQKDAVRTLEVGIEYLDKVHKPHTICEIGKERIRRAGHKIKEEAGLTAPADLDIGFRCLRLDESNMEKVYYTPDAVTQQNLFSMVDNVKPDRTPEDLLFQVMLDLGVLLSSPIEAKEIAGKKVFNVADGFLLACFDHDVTDETVKAIAQMKPYYAVFRDSSMANDSVATNFDQIFETYSPDTVRKVL